MDTDTRTDPGPGEHRAAPIRHRRRTVRPHRFATLTSAALLPAVAFAVLVLASAGFSASASAKTKTPPIDAPCQQVAAVLSDGPDPGADPVGYAQAQVIQLRELKLSDKKLKDSVRDLATAYERYAKSDGKSKPDKTAVKKDAKAVNKLCPGAGAAV